MATAAGAPRCAQCSQFTIDVGRRPRGPGEAKPLEDGQGLPPLGVTQAVASGRVLSDRVAHDVALGLSEPCRRPADFRHRLFAERESDACHN